MEFIRWGNLSPIKNKWNWGNKKMLSFKVDEIYAFERQFFLAPKERGFYAFPLGLHDKRLIYGGGSIATGRYRYLRDSNGHKIMVRPIDYYDHTLDGRWIWNISYCSYSMTPYYHDLLSKIGVNPKHVMIYSETQDGRYDPRVWLRRAFWGADHEPGIDDETKVDTEITYPLVVENKPHRFCYNGNIWHHFETSYPKVRYKKKVHEEWWNQLSKKEKKEYIY